MTVSPKYYYIYDEQYLYRVIINIIFIDAINAMKLMH